MSTGHEFGAELEKTLPSSWYTDETIFELEKQHIFFNEWLCVGRSEELPEQGDHKLLDVCGESVLLVRNLELKINAFYNVCRHRGAQLCAPESSAESLAEGSHSSQPPKLAGGVLGKNRIVCPYHAWRYDLDGQLVNAPHMGQQAGFATENVSLHKIACHTWGGFIFLNLNYSDQHSFTEFTKAIDERLTRYPLVDLRVAKRISYQIDANWKVLCENYNECYHCGPVHPELCQIVPAFREAGGANLDWEQGVPHREGADTFTWTGSSSRPSFKALNQNEQDNHFGELLYPNLFLSLSRDHVVAFLLHPKGPRATEVECVFLFEEQEMRKSEFDGSDAIEFWDLVNRQDWAICERVQKGLSSRIHQYGVFSFMEDWNLDIRKYVSDRIGPHVKPDQIS